MYPGVFFSFRSIAAADLAFPPYDTQTEPGDTGAGRALAGGQTVSVPQRETAALPFFFLLFPIRSKEYGDRGTRS
jgi:hypothetical protein